MRDVAMPDLMNEKHYTIKALAEMWSLSQDTVLRLVRVEPDVCRVGKGKRNTYRIPESVARRIHTKMFNGIAGRAAAGRK
jgi:hypothetical protein